MTITGWSIAALLSLPQVGVFHVSFVTDEKSQFYNMMVCESIWRFRPMIERQIYLTFIGIVVFDIPFLIIMVCYISIFLKISHKATEASAANSNKKQSCKPGKVHLQSTGNSSLTKAKIKTMKMTIVILTAFIVCGIPYHILEGIYNFGDHRSVPPIVSAIIGAMAVANSAINPYVFLLFNANMKCVQGVVHCCKPRDHRGYYESTIGTRTEYTMDRTECTTNGGDGGGGGGGSAAVTRGDKNNHFTADGQTECVRLTSLNSQTNKKQYSRVADEEK